MLQIELLSLDSLLGIPVDLVDVVAGQVVHHMEIHTVHIGHSKGWDTRVGYTAGHLVGVLAAEVAAAAGVD